MTTGARDAFDTVGDDEELTEEQLDRLMQQLAANVLDHGDDEEYRGILDGASIAAIHDEEETDDDIRYRFGFGERAEEEEAAFERQLNEDYDL